MESYLLKLLYLELDRSANEQLDITILNYQIGLEMIVVKALKCY